MTTVTARLPRSLRRAGRPLARVVRSVQRRRKLRDAIDTITSGRGVRLVLTYHRVSPRDEPRYEVVPTIPLDLFREQLHAFGELGRIVPLQTLVDEPEASAPLELALTFDDDYATHARHVLPVLRELGLRGTFFLSGRALHGLGGYWFQRLEALLAERGLRATATLLDVPDATAPQLPLRCEGDARRIALIEQHAPPGDAPLDAAGIRALSVAGMTTGFHTIHHPVLPLLDEVAQREALTVGRDRLAAHTAQDVNWFAYPHGKADERTVRLAREAGYTDAWTTQPHIVRPSEDPLQRGRWEPQPLRTDDLLIVLAQFLQRTVGRLSSSI